MDGAAAPEWDNGEFAVARGRLSALPGIYRPGRLPGWLTALRVNIPMMGVP